MKELQPRRWVQVDRKVIGPVPPRTPTFEQRGPRDFPGVARPHLDLARALSSPLLLGPPLCDELVAFVVHTFTEDEADVARHLGNVRAMTTPEVARAARRPSDEVERLLRVMGFEKFTIGIDNVLGETQSFRLVPIMPGIFENVLMGQRLETLGEWHRRFAELFEALYATGYMASLGSQRMRFIRWLPHSGVAASPAALPSDRLEVVIDRYSSFAILQCQCRMAATVVGHGCGRPLGNCLIMGEWAESAIRLGQGSRVSARDALEIKRAAEHDGLVSWIVNVEGARGQACCSCCGCCCHAMRSINEFNAPASSAPPHFQPAFDRSKCAYCGRCARACPMGALLVDHDTKTARHMVERCIGCGLCAVACTKRHAISMEPVPDYRLPPESWLAMLVGSTPGIVRNALSTYWSRSRASTWWKG